MLREQPPPISANGSAYRLRRFTGPEADELFILCSPESTATNNIVGQTESVYRTLHKALRAQGGGLRHIVHERVFFRDIQEDLAVFQEVRSAMLKEAGCRVCRPASTYIEQAPLDERERLEVSAFAVIPRRREARFGRTMWNTPPCECAARARFAARVIRLGSEEHLYAGSIYGSEGSAFREAFSLFLTAEDVLAKAGLTFREVVRTWIHLRDIDRDYAEFNRARREFFKRAGITVHPASTGIGGAPFAERHNFSLSLYAIKSPQPVQIGRMTTPTLNEAWMYGSDFSRGLKVVEANKVALYVSGTASVDENGETAHVGDFAGQVDRMITNVSTLLAAQNASFDDVVSAITYVKNAADAPLLRGILRDRGLEDFPNALVRAAVCRPDLLCEMEVIAALPRPESGAQSGD